MQVKQSRNKNITLLPLFFTLGYFTFVPFTHAGEFDGELGEVANKVLCSQFTNLNLELIWRISTNLGWQTFFTAETNFSLQVLLHKNSKINSILKTKFCAKSFVVKNLSWSKGPQADTKTKFSESCTINTRYVVICISPR